MHLNSSSQEELLTKKQLAEKLVLTVRGVEGFVALKKIPVLKISPSVRPLPLV